MSTDKINPFYKTFNEKSYTDKINTPAKSDTYYHQFHRPLIEEAKRHADGPVKVLDLACGHGHEMDFLAGDPGVRLFGMDISMETLRDSTRKRLGSVGLVAGDVERSPIAENSMDVGIAVNAVVYKPDHMLRTLFDALKPGGRCAVNFRIFSNRFNQPFYQYYLDRGCTISDRELRVGQELFTLKVLDYRQCTDTAMRSLDRQVYFQSVEDVERLARTIGFDVHRHQYFHFASPANPDNEVDVYWFEKPWKPPHYQRIGTK
ncbi:MAG: methyltransferase domain-containing protein [Candidatus Peribacteraceae bacterium]|nr:methyltransferase domain-containing protein [Candidatus Peribacteraceae bacterium]